MSLRKLLLDFPIAVLIFCWVPLMGQIPSPAQGPSTADQPPAAPSVAPVARDSPRASLSEFFDAARRGQWQTAARYLSLPTDQQSRGPELAERLKAVFDTNWVDLETVSPESQGKLDDGLPASVEELRRINVKDSQPAPVRMVKTSDASGAFWAFSPATVARIDDLYTALPNRWLREVLVSTGLEALLRPGPFDVLRWQWLALPLLVLLSWAAGRLLHSVVSRTLRLVLRTGSWGDRFAESLGPPLRLIVTVAILSVGVLLLGLVPPALRVYHTIASAVVVFAMFWALWRSTGVLTDWVLHLSWAAHNPSSRSLVAVGANLVRAAIFLAGILAVIAEFGYPVGTVLAGLGIGGLAVAFGAQKTVENLFGSISLAVDQPFRVGDFVKVEDFVGTVEEIGLRSTRIRTLDRTVISIPNGKLADQRLESFQVRDRMRLATTIGIAYGTTQSQMNAVLKGFERVLREHPKIWPDAVVVKFKEFGANSLDIEIMAWFDVPTWGDFQLCREEVLLGFMGVVEDAGTNFALPTRAVHLVSDTTAPGRGAQQARLRNGHSDGAEDRARDQSAARRHPVMET